MHTEPDAVIGVTPWQFTRLAYATCIRERVEPLEEEVARLREALQMAVDALELARVKSNPLQRQGEDYIWRPATAIYMHSNAALTHAATLNITPKP